MPVEASDIVQTVMDTGDSSYTGCEEAGRRSDDGVRKKTERTRETGLSNQIHNTKVIDQRKQWKSRPASDPSCKDGQITGPEFSAVAEILLWKSRTLNSLCDLHS